MSLSYSEVETFINNVLKFSNWKTLLEEDKVKFLRVLMAHYAQNLYFQNITMAATAPESRKVPTEDDIKAAGLGGIGGACITQNTFFVMLLKALNFNSYVISGFVHGPNNQPDNHVMCAVEFSVGEKYVIDVGVGLPFAEPILIQNLPYCNKGGGFRYIYRESAPRSGVYHRVQLDGSLFGEEYEDKSTEYIRYEFTTTPKTVDFFEKPLTSVFTDISDSIFLQHPFMFRYFDENQSGELSDEANVFGNRKWILIRGMSVLIGDDNSRQVTHHKTYDEVKNVISKYFPKFRADDIEKAFQYFNETVPQFGYFKATKKSD